MKNSNYICKALLFAFGTSIATASLAAPATIPNTFSAGTAAVAGEVNDNFAALKSAIDDNDSKINTPTGGFVSVSAHAFKAENRPDNCNWDTSVGTPNGFFNTPSVDQCDAVTGIQIPHKAVIQSLTCYLVDSVNTGDIRFVLYRTTLSGGTATAIYDTPTSVDGGFQIQSLADTTVSNSGDNIIDNQLYSYYIAAEYGANTNLPVGSLLTIYGCTVAY